MIKPKTCLKRTKSNCFANLAGSGAQLFAGTGSHVCEPFQSSSVASLAWLGCDRHAPCEMEKRIQKKEQKECEKE